MEIKTTLEIAVKLRPYAKFIWFENNGEKHWDVFMSQSPELSEDRGITVNTMNNSFTHCRADKLCFVEFLDYETEIDKVQVQLNELKRKQSELEKWLKGGEYNA